MASPVRRKIEIVTIPANTVSKGQDSRETKRTIDNHYQDDDKFDDARSFC